MTKYYTIQPNLVPIPLNRKQRQDLEDNGQSFKPCHGEKGFFWIISGKWAVGKCYFVEDFTNEYKKVIKSGEDGRIHSAKLSRRP